MCVVLGRIVPEIGKNSASNTKNESVNAAKNNPSYSSQKLNATYSFYESPRQFFMGRLMNI